MPRDELLSKKFFSYLDTDAELNAAFQEEKDEIINLIKIRLYPNEKAIYYSGKHNDKTSLDAFINTEDYTLLQTQLKRVIEKLKTWGETYAIKENDSLDDFLIKLAHPTEKISVLYTDGKRSLETIVVLLDDDHIELELRKNSYNQLLVDNELSKCIDGCYTRISSIAQQLQGNRENANQVNRWIRSYANEVAKEVAAKRPFAMPESYQVLICRTLNIGIETNELHASNFLLAEARENGFPIDVPYDGGALEIANKIKAYSKYKLVELYLDELNEKIRASQLVEYIATRLHQIFNTIMSNSEKGYLEKIAALEYRLNLVGLDQGFLLEEILDDETFDIKSSDNLKITIERRLSQKKWLNPVEKGELNLSGEHFFYYNFPNNIELNWFLKEGKTTRYRFMDLIEENDQNFDPALKFQILIGLIRTPLFINHAADLHILLTKNSLNFSPATVIPVETFVELLKTTSNPLLFIRVLKNIEQEKAKHVLKLIGKTFISNILLEGIYKSSAKRNFFWLDESYFTYHLNSFSRKDALEVTQGLLQQIILKGFREFDHFKFYELEYINYLENIDFSNCNLDNAYFFQRIKNCQFDQASLKGAIFYRRIAFTSFNNADLRYTEFLLGQFHPYFSLDLDHAYLNTRSLENLLNAGITEYVNTDLASVDFQSTMLVEKKLALDFSGANLENTDLREIDFSHIKLHGSNMKNTNLIDAVFDSKNLNEQVMIQGATLSLKSAHRFFFEAQIKKFDGCKIFQAHLDFSDNALIKFESASFLNVHFSGYFFDIEFQSCDFHYAKFSSLSKEKKTLMSNVQFFNSQLSNTEFCKIKFLEPFKLQACSAHNLILDDAEMSASVLFKFYQSGQRNFSGVSALKGKIPEKLPPMPLVDASLSKEVFVHLYRHGLRDFRASNLYGFYLREILAQEAISEIELKLEGAHYKQSILGCSSSPTRKKRNISPVLSAAKIPCVVNFLFQQETSKVHKKISWENLFAGEDLSRDSHNNFIEVILGPKPLRLLNLPDQINFYWAYGPNNEDFFTIPYFIKESTQSLQRKTIKLNLYIGHPFDTAHVVNLGKSLQELGFIKGQLNYYTLQNQLTAIDLNGVAIPRNKLNQKMPHSKLPNSPLIEAEKTEVTRLNKQRTRLSSFAAQLKRVSGSGLRSSLRQGAHYDLGMALMHFIATAIAQANAPEAKNLDELQKIELRHFAQEFLDKEATVRHANDHQRQLTWDIVSRCIEQGECSDPERVQADIRDTLQTLRSDIQIGNEVLWQKINGLFSEIGSFFSKKFNEIVISFRVINSVSILIAASKKAANGTRITKRKLPFWYDKPILIPLIKYMASVLEEFGCDVDPSVLAGLLYDVTLGLEKQGVTNDSSTNLSLFLLDNELFTQSVLEGTYLTHSKILYSRNNKNKTTVDIDQYLTNQTLLNIAPLVNITLEISERTNSSYFIDSRKIQVDEENKKVNDTTPFKRVDLDHQLHNRSNTNSNVTKIRIKRYVPTEQKEDNTNRALDFLDHYDRRHDKRSHSKKSSKKINTLRTKHTLSKTQNTKKEGLVQRPTNKSYHAHQPQIIAKSNNTHYLPIKNTKKPFHAEAKFSKHLYSQKELIFPVQAKTDQFFSEKKLQKFPPPRIDRDFKKPTNSEKLRSNSASKSLTRVVEPINVHANLLLIKWGFYHFAQQEKNNHRVASHKKIQAYKNTLNYMERKNLQDFYNPTQKFNSNLKI